MKENMMRLLAKQAMALGEKLETEWAEENEEIYLNYEEMLNKLYIAKDITADEYNALGMMAFYDYDVIEPFNAKRVVELTQTMQEVANV